MHFVRFLLTPEQQRALGDASVPAEAVIEHPGYSARATLSAETRAALAADLAS